MSVNHDIHTWRRLRWEKAGRYYEAYLHQDLWGSWVLTRVWGRRGSPMGRIMSVPCSSYEDALRQLDSVQVRRQRRGYVLHTK